MQKLSWSDRDSDAKYVMVDVLTEYVRSSSAPARSSRQQVYSILRGFFAANRAPLPEDKSFRVLGEPPVTSRMTVDDLRSLVMAATLRDRSWLLVKIMGFMGWRELEYTNLHCGQEVIKQMRKDPIRIDVPQGRKGNDLPYHMLFGGSAREHLKRFIDEQRGPIREDEAIWYTKYGDPMTAPSFESAFKRLTRRVGLVPAHEIGNGKHHGHGGHETRDIVRSLWHRRPAVRI